MSGMVSQPRTSVRGGTVKRMILLGYAALAPGTRLRGAFSHGKGPSVPIGSAGRLITLIAAAVILTVGVRGLLRLN